METPNKSTVHWSIRPLKLSIILAVLLAVINAVYMALMQSLVNGMLYYGASATPIMAMPLLLGVCYAILATVVLRAQELQSQALQGIEELAENRITWVSLPGLAVAAAVQIWAFLRLRSDPVMGVYALNMLSSTLSGLLSAALPVLLAAMLLPVLKNRTGLTVGALIVTAVLFVPALTVQALGNTVGTALYFWLGLVHQLLRTFAYALTAAALFMAVHRRLWDALALQCGLSFLLNFLTALWGIGVVIGGSLWLITLQDLSLWLPVVLIALYCLLMWDRGASPAGPFKAVARRIRSLAGHFLPT